MNKEDINNKKSANLEALLSKPFNPLIKWGLSFVIVFISLTMFLFLSKTTVIRYTIHPYKCYENRQNNIRTVTVYTYQQLPQWVTIQKKIVLYNSDYRIIQQGDVISISKYHNKFVIILRIENIQNFVIENFHLTFLKEQSYFSVIFATLKASITIHR